MLTFDKILNENSKFINTYTSGLSCPTHAASPKVPPEDKLNPNIFLYPSPNRQLPFRNGSYLAPEGGKKEKNKFEKRPVKLKERNLVISASDR